MSDDRICERCSGTRIVDSRACPNCGVVLPAPPGERPKPLGDKPGTRVFGHFYVTNLNVELSLPIFRLALAVFIPWRGADGFDRRAGWHPR